MKYSGFFIIGKIGIAVLALVNTLVVNGQVRSTVFLGGSIGMAIPTNMGEKEFNIGFADVANSGPRLAAEARWFYNPRLSLNGELAYAFLGQDDQFWDVSRYGQVEASYQMAQLTAHGNYYFQNKGTRPYVGIGFGAYALNNVLSFQSAYQGTNADASVSYKTLVFKPGIVPQIGFVTPASKKSLFFVDLKLQIIPNLKPEVVYIKDENGVTVDAVTQNPHGHQNHWVLSMGLIWGMD